MQLTSANLNTNNTIFANRLTTNGFVIDSESIAISGLPVVNSTQISLGQVSITPAGITTPSLFVGGHLFDPKSLGIVNAQFFTTSGTWTKPPTANDADPRNQVFIMMWGGGGGSAANGTTRGASGGGGACSIMTLPLSSFTNTCSVTVGVGGIGVSGVGSTAGNGSNSVFVVNSSCSIIAPGGGGGRTSTTSASNAGGGGGGIFGQGTVTSAGGPLAGSNSIVDSTYGGTLGANNGVATPQTPSTSIFGGGGGGVANVSVGGTSGGSSIFGGGGGGSGDPFFGASVFGGRGGYGNSSALLVAPLAPGGGGGQGIAQGNTSGQNGARGEVRVWLIGPADIPALQSYFISPNTTFQYEGNTVTFNISTVGVANNTTLYYTLNNSSTAVRNDFTAAVNGSITVVSGSASFTLTANNSAAIEADRTYSMDLRVGSTSGNIVARTSNITVVHNQKDLSYRTVVTSSTDEATSYTFNNVDIGAPSLNRYVVFAVQNRSSDSAVEQALTVDGQSTTVLLSNGGDDDFAFYGRAIPTGTTANLVLTKTSGSTFLAASIGVYAVYNLSNTTPVYADFATQENLQGTKAPSWQVGDILIFHGYNKNSVTNMSFSGGPAGLTQNYNALMDTGVYATGGSVKATDSGTQVTTSISSSTRTGGIVLR